MSVRFVKHSTVESGVFNSTNDRFRIKLSVGPGNCYNMKDSYLLLNLVPDGNGTNVDNMETGSAACVHNFKFGNKDGVDYLPSCLFENCKLISDKKGILESNIKRNLFKQTLSKYMYDDEEFEAMQKYGYSQSVNKETSVYDTHFLNRVNSGTADSSQKSNNVIIPLSDLFELGNVECLPFNEVGNLEVELEMENNQQVFTDALILPGLSQPAYACGDKNPGSVPEQRELELSQQYASVAECPFTRAGVQQCLVEYTAGGVRRHSISPIDPATAFTIAGSTVFITFTLSVIPQKTACTDITVRAFNDTYQDSTVEVIRFTALAGAGKTLTTSLDMTPDTSPLYVGMPLTITYLDATPVQQTTRRKVTNIAQNGTKLAVTVDGTANIPISSSIYAYQTGSKASVDGTSPRATINRADIVIVEEPSPSGKLQIVYNKIMVEAFNKPDNVSYFEKVYHLDAGIQKLVLMNTQDSLISNMQQVANYRLYYDNKSNTDRSIVPKQPLYYDRILRAFGRQIHCLEEGNNDIIISDLVLTERPDPMLMVQIRANNGQTLGAGDILYLFKFVPAQV